LAQPTAGKLDHVSEVITACSDRPFALVVHGGAGGPHWRLTPAKEAGFHAGLTAAYRAGETILKSGGGALDAVCAAVSVLEDDPLFNAGHGASLTAAGTVEHDASVMTGDGRGGAVTLSRHTRHPVLLARAILHTPEVLVADPADDFVAGLGLELWDNGRFITPDRRQHLAELQATGAVGLAGEDQKHGTVGCVAWDSHGHVAAATSTGGYDNKPVGRIGDTPVLGAGTWAKDGVVAVSCTGRGESFMQGAVASQVSARIEFGRQDLAGAASETIDAEVGARGTTGALIAVTPDGHCVLAWDAPTLLAAWYDGELRTHI
jgi:beta-aspartyl-peptidase (threonine type)